MSESSSSRSNPFKSKKQLMDSPCSKSKSGIPNAPSVGVPTPERPLENMFTRSRNRSVALSVKEIRQAAGSRSRSDDPVVNFSSAKSRLVFSHDDYDASSSSSKRVSSNKNAEKEKLPEKYETLGKFFDALDSSIILSKLRGSKPTFSNISGKIEGLTERRFCYSHLAQIKHILPEAIEIKKVLIYDERTSCMKPDLHITLNAEAVEYNEKSKSESKKIALRKVFRARLADFVKAHPQGDEVPQEPLPELYSRRKPDANSIDEVQIVSSVSSMPVVASSIPARLIMEEVASIPASRLLSSPIKVTSTPVKTASTPVPMSSLGEVPSTPAKIDSTRVIVASTPPEFASTPARLYSTSLASRSLKRSSGCTTPDDVSTDPPVKLARRSLLRSLNFDSHTDDEKDMNVKDDKDIDQVPEEDVSSDDEDIDQVPEEDISSDDEILSILPDKLRQSVITYFSVGV